jgi:DNA adenine methylase
MRYMGGKAKIAKHIVSAIMTDTEARDRWVEPFVGGANVIEHAAPHFRQARGYDLHPDLILLWKHVASGGALPETVTREMYAAHRHAEPSWLRGVIGFGASFGGKWFGGYGAQKIDARHRHETVYPGSRSTLLRQGAVFASHPDIRFERSDYVHVNPAPGSVVYCDPPYLGTTAYASGAFDHRRFYQVIQSWAADCFVYVSEYQILPGVAHRMIWERERRTSLKKDVNAEVRLEKLFRILPESDPWP